MSEVRNNGIPLLHHAPKANITQSIIGLAAAITEDLDVSKLSEKGGLGRWLSFWPNRGKEKEPAESK
jgi:hypothetical protein